MLRCLIAVACSLWATYSFGQSSPASIPPGSTAEIVCGSKGEEVVLHATASATLPIVDILSCGDHLTVVAKQTGWYRVRTQDGKEGYVKDILLAATPPVGQATGHTRDGYIKCTPGATGVNLLQSSEGYFMMRCGEKVEVLEEEVAGNKDAYKIKTSGGSVGHVWRGFVSWKLETAQAQALEAQARDAGAAQSRTFMEEVQSKSVGYAIQAASITRSYMLDPTSFTVLQAVALTKREKNGGIVFKGCIRYLASNSFGGKIQRWQNYWVLGNGRVQSWHWGWTEGSWSPSYDLSCDASKNDVQTDVTAEVKDAISKQQP